MRTDARSVLRPPARKREPKKKRRQTRKKSVQNPKNENKNPIDLEQGEDDPRVRGGQGKENVWKPHDQIEGKPSRRSHQTMQMPHKTKRVGVVREKKRKREQNEAPAGRKKNKPRSKYKASSKSKERETDKGLLKHDQAGVER